MLLHSVHIHSFAGLTGRRFEFGPGLNVLLGPNQAGKSTFFRALSMALETELGFLGRDTKLGKGYYESLASAMPLAGGDTLWAEVGFATEGETFKLEWRSDKDNNASQTLTLPGGNTIQNRRQVAAELARLKGANAMVWRSMLFSSQGFLDRALFDMETSQQDSLIKVLQDRAMAGSGAGTVESVRNSITERIKDLSDHWDFTSKQPARDAKGAGKDIENPWKKEVGAILHAYYERRHIEQELASIKAREADLDVLAQALAEVQAQTQRGEQYLQQNLGDYDSALHRAPLQSKTERLAADIALARERRQRQERAQSLQLQAVYDETECRGRLATHKAKEKAANEGEALRKLVAVYQRVQPIQETVEELTAHLAGLPSVTKEHASQARTLQERMLNAGERVKQMGIEAMLVLENGAAPIELTQVTLKGNRTTHSLSAGQSLELEAAGRLLLDLPGGLHLQVELKNANLESITKSGRDAREQMQALLAQVGWGGDVEALTTMAERRGELLSELAANQKNLARELAHAGATATYAELHDQCADLDPATLPDKSAYERTLATLQAELKSAADRKAAADQELATLAATHADKDLADQLATLEADLRQTRAELEAMPPLAGRHSGDFVDEYRRSQEKYYRLKDQLADKMVQFRTEERMLSDMPESADLEARLTRARTREQGLVEEHGALTILISRLNQAAAHIEAQAYEPFKDALQSYAAIILGEGYRIRQGEGRNLAPAELTMAHGNVQLRYLSQGARDALALAYRLACAEHYLADKEGFLVLDDPLVDMDDERAAQAVAAIRHFAQRKQVIVNTCHHRLAEMLGGHRIELYKRL